MKMTRWMPLALSATVYPGAGQFAQKRKVWGIIYATSFTFFLVIGLRLLIPAAWDFFAALLAGHPPPDIAWLPLLKPLAVATGILVANIYDVWWNIIKAPPQPHP